MTDSFNGVPFDAPLFNKASLEDLRKIVKFLADASYHYADDSGREWGTASLRKMQAAQLINELKLGASAIHNLYQSQPQLVSYHDVIDAVLKDLRK